VETMETGLESISWIVISAKKWFEKKFAQILDKSWSKNGWIIFIWL
jgi:hypothetical protein